MNQEDFRKVAVVAKDLETDYHNTESLSELLAPGGKLRPKNERTTLVGLIKAQNDKDANEVDRNNCQLVRTTLADRGLTPDREPSIKKELEENGSVRELPHLIFSPGTENVSLASTAQAPTEKPLYWDYHNYQNQEHFVKIGEQMYLNVPVGR